MSRAGTQVRVTAYPACDLCSHTGVVEGSDGTARYDARTTMGAWAFLCEQHYERWGVGLGIGYGQRLLLVE
jgi:hypothetical protein